MPSADAKYSYMRPRKINSDFWKKSSKKGLTKDVTFGIINFAAEREQKLERRRSET